jgi:hypothetical protein
VLQVGGVVWTVAMAFLIDRLGSNRGFLLSAVSITVIDEAGFSFPLLAVVAMASGFCIVAPGRQATRWLQRPIRPAFAQRESAGVWALAVRAPSLVRWLNLSFL